MHVIHAMPRSCVHRSHRRADARCSRRARNNTIKTTPKNWRTVGDEAPPAERGLICRVQDAFRVFARSASELLGSAWVFVLAITIIIVWAATGHFYNYSDTWQLLINTGTTIVTFLMVFIIQNTQNRDSKAVHLKLDELIRSIDNARNHLVNLDRLSDEDLKKLESQFQRISKKADEAVERVEDVIEEVEEVVESESR
jgi:low affinity Fe/Cu permease